MNQRLSKRLHLTLESIEGFFLRPASPLPLAALRIALATLLLVQAILLRDWVVPFLSRDGLIQGPLSDVLRSPFSPHVGWFADWLAPFGITEVATLYGVCALYLLGVVLLLVGLFTRTAAILTWFLHWVLVTTGYTSVYGVDMYAHVFLFYMMFAPVGAALSLDSYFASARRPLAGIPTSAARLGLRVMQIQLCLAYFSSAFEKIQGEQWRSGEVLWRIFALPFYNIFDLHWLANWPSLLFLGAWATLIFEGLFFIFIWPKATRIPWIFGLLGLHLGIALFMGLHLFGIIMCIFVVCTFGLSAEPESETVRSMNRRMVEDNDETVFSPL